MKKLLPFVFAVLIPVNLSALVLPEGTNARIVDVKQERGKIISATLKAPTVLNTPLGAIKVRDKVEFFTSGNVKSCIPYDNGSFECPLAFLPYAAARTVTFYESGCIEKICITAPVDVTMKIGTVPLQEGDISLYDNWIPKEVMLNKDITLHMPAGVVSAKKGSKLTFYPSGRVESFYVKESVALDTSVGKAFVQEGSMIVAHKSAKIKSFIPEDMCLVTLGENTFYTVADGSIGFNTDGSVRTFQTSSREFKFDSVKLELSAERVDIAVHNDDSYSILLPISYYESNKNRVSINGIPLDGIIGITVTKNAVLPWSPRELYSLSTSEPSGTAPDKIDDLNFPGYEDSNIEKNGSDKLAAFYIFLYSLTHSPFEVGNDGKLFITTRCRDLGLDQVSDIKHFKFVRVQLSE